MQPQQKRYVVTTPANRAISRGELRKNVIQWREEAGASPLRVVPKAPEPKPSPFDISPSARRFIVGLVSIAAVCIYVATTHGLLQ